MKVLFLTNEYPPHIYGGAGVHVGYLARELAKTIDVDVRCFGDQDFKEGRLKVTGFELDTSSFTCPKPLQSVFGALRRDIDFNTTNIDADLVHCHTWYSHFGGILAKLNYGIPLVITTHSLEPLRPWKREQLAGGYDFSLWVEKTALEMADAIIAVSAETKRDIERLFDVDPKRVRVIHNGIDPDEYRRVDSTAALERHGIDPKRPYLLFVGRIARQKGIIHLVRAIPFMDPDFPIVLCAGAPDTPEIANEMKEALAAAQKKRKDIFWIEEMLDRPAVIELYSHAAVFCCPSIYEPFGIINLEAMACGTAVVATAVGGLLALAPLAVVVLAPVVIAVVWRWRYVSLGSITGALLAPVATGVLAATGAGTIAAVGYAAAAAILITLAHVDNIERLRSGTERRLGTKEAIRGDG